jgi:hypothetical protein
MGAVSPTSSGRAAGGCSNGGAVSDAAMDMESCPHSDLSSAIGSTATIDLRGRLSNPVVRWRSNC